MVYYDVEIENDEINLVEHTYNKKYILKTESIFAQCNGYMGVRGSLEWRTLEESRGMFVAGFFNKAYDNEVIELVNCPDVIGMDIYLNNHNFTTDTADIKTYKRSFDVKSGVLTTEVICKLQDNSTYKIITQRFVSLHSKNLICQKVEITPMDSDGTIAIITGINGQVTNSGVSHFKEVISRVYNKSIMHTEHIINENMSLCIMAECKYSLPVEDKVDFILKRRSIYGKYKFKVAKGSTLKFEKYSFIQASSTTDEEGVGEAKKLINYYAALGYKVNYYNHLKEFWAFWEHVGIKIEGATKQEIGAIHFAQYHLLGMTPAHTNRYSVAAKGLTGEGYKGHVFWDTEIFILPFLAYTNPKYARNLLEYRYYNLDGARHKAIEYGYRGAMFPWESAVDGKEETPLYAALNIHTGKPTRVWSGIKEHHVTADIAFAVWYYYTLTADQEFMDKYGYEMILECATFWASRVIYIQDKNRYEIHDIIGPDEYTEHINNNTYTNYMAYYCIELSKNIILDLQTNNQSIYRHLDKKLDLSQRLEEYRDISSKFYLPQPNENGIIPQDDTFLDKPILPNIEKYKLSKIKQSILLDYSRQEVIDMQVLKQADIVMLMNLLYDKFDSERVKENVLFYEQRTVHDSSLSMCAHVIACANIGEVDMAYEFFRQAMLVDLCDNPNGSKDGIHAASLGGIWMGVVNGFCGVKHTERYLEISPKLPSRWDEVKFNIIYQGEYIKVTINKGMVHLIRKTQKNIEVKVNNTLYLFNTKELIVELKK